MFQKYSRRSRSRCENKTHKKYSFFPTKAPFFCKKERKIRERKAPIKEQLLFLNKKLKANP
jgi:hypothetical protein